ncbi:MAG: nuclear transport factor 2 family protein [Candidatus Omnitrophica bacterium]|nr:nuclear transport factor 2 family protein [Candidatus Omnitrophota bacterium]
MDTEKDEIKKWLTKFALYVREQDFAGGREMFYEDVVCFGSRAEILCGLDDLIERQWKAIWPNITAFNFLTDKFHCEFSADGKSACVIVPWISTGYHEDGTAFPRPGRVTILLIRDAGNNTWLAKHTHYSLYPGTPNHTFGPQGTA